jgi:long-subunit fatty acid transport protein
MLGIVFVLLTGVLPVSLYAQNVELTVLGGWQWTAKVNTTEGDIKVSDPGNFEAAIGYYIQPGLQAELSYTYTKAVATIDPEPASTIPAGFLADVAFHYFLVSGLREIETGNEKVVPYVLGSLGTVYIHPTNSVYDDTWKFAFGFGAGAKIYLSERFGLRLQARLLMPVFFEGLGFWFGTGGADVGYSGAIPIVQGDLSGGLTARF